MHVYRHKSGQEQSVLDLIHRFCDHYYGYILTGSQVDPIVRSVAIQCCISDEQPLRKSTETYSILSSHLLLPSKVSQRNPNQKCPSAAMINLVILTQVPILLKMKARRKL